MRRFLRDIFMICVGLGLGFANEVRLSNKSRAYRKQKSSEMRARANHW